MKKIRYTWSVDRPDDSMFPTAELEKELERIEEEGWEVFAVLNDSISFIVISRMPLSEWEKK